MADFPERPASFNDRWWSMVPESPNVVDDRRRTLGRAFGPAPVGGMQPQGIADLADDPSAWGAQPAGHEDPAAWGAQPVPVTPPTQQVDPSSGFMSRLGRGLHKVTDAMTSFSHAVHGEADDDRLGSQVGRAIPDISDLFQGALLHDLAKVPGQTIGTDSSTSLDEIRPVIKQKLLDAGFDEAAAERKTEELYKSYAQQEGAANLIMAPMTALISPIIGMFRSSVSRPIEETTGFPKESTEMAVMTALGVAGIRGVGHQVEGMKFAPRGDLTRVRIEPNGQVTAEQVGNMPAQADFTIAGHELSKKPASIGGGDWNGLDLSYEVPTGGGKRQNVAPDGSTYETQYTAGYGEIKGTRGGDGDPIDFYMGPNPDSQRVFVIDEISQGTRKWKQTKPMLGFLTEDEAVAGYLGTSTKSEKSIGAVTEMTVDEFKAAIAGNMLDKPVASPSLIERRLREMYEERGTHPAEVVNDAQRDAFVRSEIATPSFDAWHGSPSDFTAFDVSKTAEGVQLTMTPERASTYALGKGTLYKVIVNAPAESFLERGMPIQQQSGAVREAIAGINAELGITLPEGATGGDFYLALSRALEGDGTHLSGMRKANEMLRDRGVPGITAADAFIVFDDKLLQITEKNGVEFRPTKVPTATNSPVMPGSPRSDLARTGVAHVDAVLNDPVVARAIDNAVINRDYDVPHGSGASVPAQDPTVYIDRHFPRTLEADGVRFDPAEPFIIRETIEQHVTEALVKGGMDEETAQRVARVEYAAPAEAQWYASHAIDQAAAEAAFRPFLDRIEAEHQPPNLYDKGEPAAEPKPTKAELTQAKDILQPEPTKPLPDLREELWDLIKINAPLELIEAHPMVNLALEEARALPKTGHAEDFKMPEVRTARVYDFNGERVQGTDAAVQRLIDQAIRFAGGVVGKEKRAIIVIGPPAAGKSSVSDVIAPTRRAAIVDPDEAKQVIPEYRGGIGAMAVHEESSVMAKDMLARFGEDGSNIVLPKVGDNVEQIRDLTNALRDRGYTVDLIHVAATQEISRRRNIIRMLQLGRILDPKYLTEVGDRPRDTFYMLKNEGLYDETADISTVARYPQVIDGNGPVASAIRARNASADAQAAAGGDSGLSRAAAAGADLTRPENLTSPRLRQQPAPRAGSFVNEARASIDKLMNVGRGLQYYLDPMATGSKDAMTIAKDAISLVRRIHWEHARFDNEITRRFDPESWERMWNAVDEESVLQQRGEKGMGAAEHMGLATLTREERYFVDYIQGDTQEAWLHALDVGIVEGEGLPSYAARMAINVAFGLGEGSPKALNELGRNVFTRTSQMKHRRHLLAEDTEAALKDMVSKRMAERGASAEDIAAKLDEVKVARNIRALPLAAANLKEAAVWRDMINKIEDHGKAAGKPTVWYGEAPAPGWFTIEGNPAFTKWEPVTELVKDVAGEPYFQTVLNNAGEPIMKKTPIYLSDEFKGPMDAILDGGWRQTMRYPIVGVEGPTPYGMVMAVKSRAMLAILNSPLIHNAVVWSKVMEAAGGREWLGFGLYRRGNTIVNGPPQRARELIERGLAPMGPRGAMQNISDMMDRPNLAEDHHVSWTGKLLAAVPRLFDRIDSTLIRGEPQPLTREQATDKMRTLITAGKSTPEIATELNLPPVRVDSFKQAHDLVQTIAKEISPTEPHPLWDKIYQDWNRTYPGAKAEAGDITDFVSRMTPDQREGLIAKLNPEDRAEYDARQARVPDKGGTNLPEREEGMLHLAFSDAEQMGGAQISAGDLVERSIAKLGNYYHNTLLWDRVRDVQFGLADFLSDRLTGKGVDRLTADRVAAHFSNIIVGSIPKEAMSAGARGWANALMFSRSFTLGNLSTFKQAALGLPKPILAQLERDFRISAGEGLSPEGLASLQAQIDGSRDFANGLAKRKAVATVLLSVALYYIGNAIFQHAFNIAVNDSTLDEELRGYARRFSDLMNEVANDPFEPRNMIARLSPTADNEPNKSDRVHMGFDKDGTAIYGRNPTGKFGEEMFGYPTMPMEMVRRKMSPMLSGILGLLENDKGFGKKIYDENDKTITGTGANVIHVAKYLVMKHLPEGQIEGALDLLRGEGDPTVNKLRTFGPLAGFTASVGAPGGQARGEAFAEKQQFDARFNLAWPDISKQIKRGDVEAARERMTGLGVLPRMQEGLIRNALDPSGALHGATLRNFLLRATPQQLERYERAQQRGPGPRQPGATP